MSLLRQIQEASIASDGRLGEILRMAKVLAARLDQEELGQWVDAELNGYRESDVLPGYRILHVQSRGTFMGPLGGGWKNVPIPALSVSPKYRELVDTHRVVGGVASIEALIQADPANALRAPWSPDLIALEGKGMMQGLVLAEAWQEVPRQAFVAILDTVRNRILDFALEVERKVPSALGEHLDSAERSAVSQIFNITVLGGMANVAAGNTVSDGGGLSQSLNAVRPGDIDSLREYLLSFGVESEDITDLECALRVEPTPEGEANFGETVSKWIGKMVSKAASGVWQVSVSAAGSVLARAIAAYYGLDAGGPAH